MAKSDINMVGRLTKLLRARAVLVGSVVASLFVASATIYALSPSGAGGSKSQPSSLPPAPPELQGKSPSPVVREAWGAYLATIRAFTKGDAETYYAGFAAPMECLYNRANASIREVRPPEKIHGYVEVSERDLTLVETDGATQVTFCDRGTYDYEVGGGRKRHSKAIVMRKIDGAWKIAVETSHKTKKCFVSPCGPAPQEGL